jgi:type VI secretion system protein ImpF
LNKLKPIKISVREGAPVPLFSRLVDEDPEVKSEKVVQNLLSMDELETSISNELEIILNTRTAAMEENNEVPGIPEYYRLPDFFGLRDFSAYNIETDIGQAYVAKKVGEAIVRFEPRLLNPEVRVLSLSQDRFSLNTVISGEIIVGTYRRQVTFPIVLRNILQSR